MTLEIPVHITAFYAALAALWLVVLAVRVIRLRRRHRIALNSGGNRELEVAQRIHANATEYLPTGLLLILLLELMAAPFWLLHALGVALLAGRALHFIGLRQTRGASVGRTVGTALTFGVFVAGAAALLLEAFLL